MKDKIAAVLLACAGVYLLVCMFAYAAKIDRLVP